MSQDIRKVNDMESLITYFSEKLNWNIDPDDFYDIDDITYEFEAEDLGLKDEAFAKINSLKQLQPLVDDQKWGIFFVEFDSQRFEVSALRKILSGLIPTRRNSAEHAVWDKRDLLFLCTWGSGNQTTVGAAHFEDAEKGLPQIKMISCEPAVEDFTQINIFEQKLAKLRWPSDPTDTAAWREAWASAFTVRYRQVIQDSHTLTVCLAEEAKAIRDRILNTLKVETRNGYVHLLFEKFQNTLIHDMTEQQFADMYAQTIVYGLFSARCMDNTQDDFSPEEAVACIPNTNPFLKSLMQECFSSDRTGSKLSFDELEIGNIVTLLQNTKTDAIIADFNRQTGGGREDPVIHFYEEFLTEYDKAQKVQRGVYYTPQPVVNFIVRAVDDILKSEFGITDGLASTETKKIKVTRQSKKKNQNGLYGEVEDTAVVPAIQVLDPATGTGTFLRQTILQIYQNFCDARKGMPREKIQEEWNDYVPKHLLPRLNGFELMMAPYAVAHMKLAMVLKDTGYDFHGEERLQVYLTNSLEEPGDSDIQTSFFSDPLAMESIEANGAKKNVGINVVMGNPPYRSASENNNKFIASLVKDYKVEPGGGKPLQERKNWLDDDYVKFMRYAQLIIETAKYGIVAFINPHGWLSNGGFRGMRWKVLNAFDQVFIVNLHGNSKWKEVSPDGSKDENVFDIQQGVCINIFVRKSAIHSQSHLADIKYMDVYGTREFKNMFLNKTHLEQCKWETVNPLLPMMYLVPKNFENLSDYENGACISEIFKLSSQGIMSGNDAMVMYPSYEETESIISKALIAKSEDEAIEVIQQGKKAPKNWSFHAAIRDIKRGYCIEKIRYRPFDDRYTAFTGTSCGWLWRPRTEVMSQLSECCSNICLISTRIVQMGQSFQHVFVADGMTDKGMLSSKDNAFVFPLYVYLGEPGQSPAYSNFEVSFVKRIEQIIQCEFRDICDSNQHEEIFSAMNLFDYIYACLNSPSYRTKFNEELKTEFPKIPYPENADIFWELVDCGKRLREIHLLKSSELDGMNYPFSGIGDNTISKVLYKNGTIYINKTQHFDGIEEALWDAYIGSYQPLQKWMKDRKGTILSKKDIQHYQKMISALKLTQNIMDDIDKIVQF